MPAMSSRLRPAGSGSTRVRASPCIGAVTTHDLSLAELARLPDSTLVPVHFQDVLEDGRMRFDYTLRQGVVQSTNALRVLALAGIPVRDDARE